MTVIINGTNTPTAGGVTYGNGTEYATTSAGTTGQVLISAGASAPTWGTASAATTATNLAGGSAGTVPYQSASGTTAMLAAGSSGQVLTSSGAGAPSWTTPSAGAMTFISTTTVSVSAAQVDITSGFSSTYNDYLIVLEGVVGPAKLAMRVQKSGSFQTTGYNLTCTVGQAGGPTYAGSANASQWTFIRANGMSTANRNYGTVYLLNVNSTTGQTACSAQIGCVASTSNTGCQSNFTGEQTTTAVITGIRFLDEDANNITAGTFRLYGIQKS